MKNNKYISASYVFAFLAIISVFVLISLFAATQKKIASGEEMPETIRPPLGLPNVPWPKDNPYTKEKAELGRLLYFDKRLSSNKTIACSTCHNAPCAYGDCRSIAIGIDDRKGTRHSPTVINATYSSRLFWDGRAATLEEQCKGPIANVNEMSDVDNVHEAHKQCAERVKEIPGYRTLFKKVFGHDDITIDDIAKAISTFERTLLSGNSPYDRYIAGDKEAMTPEQIRGFEVFKKSGCNNCHSDFNFSEPRFHNIGVGMDKKNPDLGRYLISKNKDDWGAFKVPTLRESSLGGPYMHDGSLKTLEEVVEYYDKGGIKNKNLHPLMQPLNLSAEDKAALVSFLKALNGEGWQHFKEPKRFPQ